MKKIFQPLLLSLTLLLALVSCQKEEQREVYLGGTAPVLSASVSGSIPLNFLTETSAAVKFSWTNPAYSFTSGPSSQDVNYALEIDVAGNGFNGGNKKSVSISKDITVGYTQKEFNIILSDLKLKLNTPAAVEVRVVATMGTGAAKLISNALKFNVTPYAPPPKVTLPLQGNLWVIGDAFASGWNNPLPAPYDVSQKFTKISETLYEGVFTFKSSGNYKILQDNGVWGTQYHKVSGDAMSGTFEKKDSDPGFDCPGAGNYKISLDFQAGTYTLTKQ